MRFARGRRHPSGLTRFLNTPPWVIIRISMPQNSEKPSGKKYMEKEHKVYIVVLHELPRQKPRVRNIRKTHSREKEYNPLNHQVEYSIIRIEILATSL